MKTLLLTLTMLSLSASVALGQPASLAIGSALPAGSHMLQMTDDSSQPVSDLMGPQGTVFIFWSNACRWTEGYQERVRALHSAAGGKGMAVVLVNSNDPEAFPEESAEASRAAMPGLRYGHDQGAALAKALGAYRTPEVFAFDAEGKLAYSGAIDDAPGDTKAVTRSYVADFIGGQPQTPTKAFGCRIRLPYD